MIKKMSSTKPAWYSSYEPNNYGDFFYSLVKVYRPTKVVELGTKAGYSAYHIARGLKDVGAGTLDCYDLWQEYQFNSVLQSVARENLAEFKKIIRLQLQNAVGVDKLYEKIDMLHVDLSNEGGILEMIIPEWIDKVAQLIIIEGGSVERDQVAWMTKYQKLPITSWLKDLADRRGDIEYFTLEPFPSLTIIRKLT